MVEDNDWENERWYFHIPIGANEEALRELDIILRDVNNVRLLATTTFEYDIDVLVEWAEPGYMAQHNKLEGRLVLTKPDDITWTEVLHKGGLYNMMVGPEDEA